MPLGLEFDYVQLAGQPASGEREAWNADALMEGVRVGTKRSEFLAALEDRVGAEEARWTPLLQLHNPDLLDDYLNKILVETGQRFFKKGPMDAPDYSDLAAKRRELLAQRLEARKSIGEDRLLGRRVWRVRRSSREFAPQRSSWPTPQRPQKQFDCGYGDEDSLFMKRSSGWRGRDGIWRPLFDGVACSVGDAGEPRRETTGRCLLHFR